jgi:hypothetical protein
MRRPEELRRHAALAASASVAFALLVSFGVFVLLGREGRLGFSGFNLAGLAEGLAFLVALMAALIWVRASLRLPAPVLLSFGLVAPPTARRVAAKVPVVDVATAQFTLADHRVVIVQEDGVPVGMSGVRRERITSWDEIVKVRGDVSVTDLRALLAHEPLVVVMQGDEVVGVVTQDAYLAGLWGRVR